MSIMIKTKSVDCHGLWLTRAKNNTDMN